MTEANMVASQPEVFGAAAFMHEVRPIRNWHEWVQLAQAATTFDQKLGLLHVGFDMWLDRREYDEPSYKADDRLQFYFDVANGWTNARHFREEGLFRDDEPNYRINNRIERTRSEQRQLLAQKAFDMLAQRYFKPKLSWLEEMDFQSREDRPIIRNYLRGLEFQLVMNFFTPREGVMQNISLRKDSRPSERQVIDFLLKLPKLIWSWKEHEIMSYDREEERLRKEAYNCDERKAVATAKSWAIEMLSALDELEVLNDSSLELDETCLAKLTEIAFRTKLKHYYCPVSEDRRVLTLDEACLAGSAAAWMLKRHELVTNERARLQEIRTAEFEATKAAQRVAELKQGTK